MEEPSVLDYVLDRLAFWRKPRIHLAEQAPASLPAEDIAIPPAIVEPALPAAQPGALPMPAPTSHVEEQTVETRTSLPWRSLLALALALAAQLSLEPSAQRTWTAGAILYALAGGFLVLAALRGEWQAAPYRQQEQKTELFSARTVPFLVGLVLATAALYYFKDNLFTRLNVSLLLLALAFLIWAFWLPSENRTSIWSRIKAFFNRPFGGITISAWSLLVVAAALLVIFFRAYQIDRVPPEMVSDQAEKLLDVWDVTHGQTSIFFPRNTGREALQMYLTAAILLLFNTGYSFLSLKIGTVLAGLLTLPYIYLLGKEVGNRRIALLALLFAGVAYWPNVISRVGLRFPLYPLFVAPTLYYLIRGLRTANRNDFILAGLALGIGLHGYTPIRILPFVVLAAVGLFLLHRQSRGMRGQALAGLVLLGFMAFVVFLPLLRYALENPEMFAYRSFTRLGSVERPLPGPALELFMGNLWRAVTMFAWDDGEIWVNSITHRPALDTVSAALFYLGAALLFVRYLRQRHWLDLFLLLSVPLLMMPSILSLAFPAENPALNRMGGAIIPVFITLAIALDGLLEALRRWLGGRWGAAAAGLVGLVLFWAAANQNYDLVFRQYQNVYLQSSWNTSEMGEVIRDFAASVGSPDTAWVAAYPYWVDTRLVGMNAGFPLKDYAIFPENFASTLSEPRAKLFLVKPEDSAALDALRQLYPQGVVSTYNSAVEGHDFNIFFIPPLE